MSDTHLTQTAPPLSPANVTADVVAPFVAPARRGRSPFHVVRNFLFPYLLLLPTLVIVAVFTIWPTLNVVWQSFFFSQDGVMENGELKHNFIGLKNYTDLLDDDTFKTTLVNTFVFVVVTTPIAIALALGFALLINRRWRGIGFFRFFFFYPTLLPMISAATIWGFVFAQEYGLLNELLRPFHIAAQNWLGSAGLALPAVMAMSIWKQAGYYMIFYLAGLQNLPTDIYEAASLDGASPLRKFLSLTVPLLRSTSLFVATIAVVASFQTTDQIIVMTHGGPGDHTRLLMFHIYDTYFNIGAYGQAQAMTVILLVLLLAFTVLNFVFTERRTTYD